MSFRQSFAWWSFRQGDSVRSDTDLLRGAAAAGMTGVEMLPPRLYGAARDHGLALVTVAGHALERGFNEPESHVSLRNQVLGAIEHAAEHRVHAVIVFAGSRGQIGDDAAVPIVADGISPLADDARDAGVTLLIELLNSRVDHPHHQCDRSAFARSVVEAVGSDHLRILYDVYHMQIMEGDLVHTIRSLGALIGHVHTAGVPGRHELGDDQEIHWPAIRSALVDIGYAGWVGHELIPTGDALDALAHAHALFDDVRPSAP
jgi:hydroxypyruvate isomerase